jgi:hypothetical protein
MSDAQESSEVPEADALEQGRGEETTPELPAEVGDRPEADALEQRRTVSDEADAVDTPEDIGLVPEADVLDQRRDAGPFDDDRDR